MATGRVPTTANSPLTAKGDLFGYSTTQARVAVGNDGETLVADSSTSTGLRYQGHIEAGKNFLINGGFDIWQRGTSFVNPAGNSYTTDRWVIYPTAATATVAQETSIVPTGSRYAVKISQATNNATNYFSQAIETANAIRLAGQTITVSGLVAASTSTAVSITVNYSTSVDVAPGGSWTAISATSGGSATPTSSTYVPISGVFAIPSTAKSLFIVFSATITAGNSIYIANTQAEIGSVATNFSRAGGTLQGELAACQRYYFQDAAAVLNAQQAVAATTVYGVYYLPVAMRANPTLTQTGSSIASSNTSATTFTYDASAASPNKVGFYVTGGASTGQVYLYRPIQVSAEL